MSSSIPRIKPVITRERIETVEKVRDLQKQLRSENRHDDADSLRRSLDYWLVTNDSVDYDRLYVKHSRFHKEYLEAITSDAFRGDESLAMALGLFGALGLVGGLAAYSTWDDKRREKKNKSS